jgi:hypothetical protein
MAAALLSPGINPGMRNDAAFIPYRFFRPYDGF